MKANLDDWRPPEKSAAYGSATLRCGPDTDEAGWLGWLDIADRADRAHRANFEEARRGCESRRIHRHSACSAWADRACAPKCWTKTFGRIAGFPQLHVLDSTDPAQVKAFESKIDLGENFVHGFQQIGITLEPNIFKQYFFERVKQTVGADKAGSRFIAITDPGSKMQQVAEADHFRHIFYGLPEHRRTLLRALEFRHGAGRGHGTGYRRNFSTALSEMVEACGLRVPRRRRIPACCSASFLERPRKSGRDKVTIITSPGISDLGAWLEQLLAESTGKQGNGIIPVDREALGAPEVYGNDRVFAYLRLESAPDAAAGCQSCRPRTSAGSRWCASPLRDVYDLGQEFFRWEIATAVAGSIIGINAFNQPDVEASKIATRELTTEYEKTGSLPAETPILEDKRHQAFYRSEKRRCPGQSAGEQQVVWSAICAPISIASARAIISPCWPYIQMNAEHEAQLAGDSHACATRNMWRLAWDSARAFCTPPGRPTKAAPIRAFSCRSLATMPPILPVPGQKYTFGVVKAAQARGDFQVLAERGRRALRVHLGDEIVASSGPD